MNTEKTYADTVPEFPANDNIPQLAIRQATRPVITVDVPLYEQYLAESDLTEVEKHEFLQTSWKIICEFVMLGYGVHPLQQVENGRGCSSGDGSLLTLDMLDLEDHQITEKFKDAAKTAKCRRSEESKHGISL